VANDQKTILVPCFGEEVAPLFAASKRFRLWKVKNNEVTDYKELVLEKGDALDRMRLVQNEGVTVLICNGIENRCRLMLETSGINVIKNIVGIATDVFFGFLAGQITSNDSGDMLSESTIRTADVAVWTEELFKTNGWTITTVEEKSLFPLQQVAEKSCPFCSKPIRVAICYGAHAYRVDEEIREFHRISSGGYHSRVYVHQAMPGIIKLCDDYGIELLDPSAFSQPKHETNSIAPLRGLVKDHKEINNK